MSEGVKFDRYLKLGNYDKVMDFMENRYENGEMGAAYFATNEYYPHLKDNARYIALLKKMNQGTVLD